MTTDDKQPLIGHLLELRDRLLRTLLVVACLFAALVAFSNDIYEFVAEPIRAALPGEATMIATNPTAAFFTPFRLTFVLALFLAAPYILYQIWSFVAPGLYDREKRIVVPIFASSVVLFYAGVAFAYFVTFPIVFDFLLNSAPDSVRVLPDITTYLDIALKLFFAFGVAFEMPIATIILIVAGVTTSEKLAAKRPYIIVGCFVVGMLLTPPDVFSQTLLAIPMWLLFEAGVFFGKWVKKPRQEAEAE